MLRRSIHKCIWLTLAITFCTAAGDKAAWQQFTQCRTITCQVSDDSVLWIGTGECGLARFSPLSGQMSLITNQNSGLPSNSVNCLAIGRDHVLWIGTDEGLAAFDGQAWRIFTTGNAPFPDNSVSAVALDDSGNVWVGFTDGGVLNYSSSGWTNLLEKQPGFPLTLTCNTVWAIAPVNNNDAWISWNTNFSDSYGLAFFDESGWHAYGYRNIQSMAADKNGAVWFPATEWGAGKYNLGIARLRFPDSLTSFFVPASLTPANVYSFSAVAIDASEKKWVGLTNTILCLNDTGWTMPPPVADSGTISSIAFGSGGTVWASLNRTNMNPIAARLSAGTAWTPYLVRSSDIPFNDVRYICPAKNGASWIANQARMIWYDSGACVAVPFIDSVVTLSYLNCICQDGSGGVWIGIGLGFIHGDGRNWKMFSLREPYNFTPEIIYADKRGLLWVGEYYLLAFDSLGNYVESGPFVSSRIVGVTSTLDNTLWAAFSTAGLLHRAADGAWTRVTKSNSALPSDTTTGIVAGPDGKLWVGTDDHGLACYANGQWTVFDTLNSGIPGQNTKPFCFDSSGSLWLLAKPVIKKCSYQVWSPYSNPTLSCYDETVPNGLVKFDGKTWTVYNTINSGLPSNTIYSVAAGDSGRIWVGTDKGLALFDSKNAEGIGHHVGPHSATGNNGIRIFIHGSIATLYATSGEIVSVLVFNAAGRKVHAIGDASVANGKVAISLPRLSPGFYIAQMNMRTVDGQSAVVQKHFVVPGN